MNHEINLTGYTATCGEPNNMLDLGTAGSYGLEKLHVTADAAWNGLTITATFTNSGSTTVAVQDGAVDVPPEATRLPTRDRVRYGMLAFKGVDAQGKLRIISTPICYKVQASAATDGSNTIEPTPDQYAQFVAEVMAEADRAEAAADRAESAGGNVTPEQIAEAVNNYLTENPVQATPIDATLTQSGQAADAAAVGDRLSALSEEIAAIPSGKDGADGKSAYQYAVDGGYTGTETEFAEKMAQEKFANPNALTFTGAVTGTYDGSAPVNVEIPSGGGGSSGFRLVRDLTLTESAESVIINSDDDGNPFSLSECFIHIFAKVTEAGKITYIPNGYYVNGTYFSSTTTTATDYSYDFGAYSVGSEEMFFGYETKTRGAAPTAYYNVERNKSASSYRGKITSYRIDAKFDAGSRFLLYGRDA